MYNELTYKMYEIFQEIAYKAVAGASVQQDFAGASKQSVAGDCIVGSWGDLSQHLWGGYL